jgi:phospholipid transport system transporter-binding protein
VLNLPSALTHESAADFSQTLRQAVLAQPADVVADASALREFDSSALAILLECRREAASAATGRTLRRRRSDSRDRLSRLGEGRPRLRALP